MPTTVHDSVLTGNMTTVQLESAQQKTFLRNLLTAADNFLTLSDLPLQDGELKVYVIPKPVEDAVRMVNGWDDDAWVAGLQKFGALAVNILSTEAVFRLMEMGRVKATFTGHRPPRPPPLMPIPSDAKGDKQTLLPLAFQGPFDWQLACCRIPQAWTLFITSPDHQSGLPWKDILVGHLDTGYSEHIALGWHNGSSQTVHPDLGHDFFENKDDPRDPFLPSGNPGHGTRTSATIAAFDPQADGTPYYGAAPGAQIIPYRVTDTVNIDHVKRLVAEAIGDALQQQCDVISISLGALFGDRRLSDALDDAYENGVIVVCAVGNYWGEVIYPARYNRCISMGGVGPGNMPWGGSAHGKFVDLCGPAQQVRRIKPENLPAGQAANELYAPPDGNGTSYATALCAGVAALWLSWHGKTKLDALYPQPWMRVAAFKRLLRNTAQVPATWDSGQYGSGIINAEALLQSPLPLASTLIKALSANDVYDQHD